MLEFSESGNSLVTGSVAAQVKSSDPLDSRNSAVPDHSPHIHDRVAVHLMLCDKRFFLHRMSPGKKSYRIFGRCRDIRRCRIPAKDFIRPQHIHPRPAVIAADRLRVITPRLRVRVFKFTVGAHREYAHRSPNPVVRHAIEDREPWSAIRAVDKWVQIPFVRRIKQLSLAVRANGKIG